MDVQRVSGYGDAVQVEELKSSDPQEINEGKAMIDAGVAAGVKLFIFSSLPSYIDISHGKVSRVHHCKQGEVALYKRLTCVCVQVESKARVEEYGRSKASDKFQFVAVQAGWYDTNVLHGLLIKKQPDGTWLWKSPISADTVLPSIDIDEFGLWVRAVIEHKELRDDGRAIPAVGEDISYRKMIDAIHKGKRFPEICHRRELTLSLYQPLEPTSRSSTTSPLKRRGILCRKERPHTSLTIWERTDITLRASSDVRLCRGFWI